jgi:hypothetical protein
MAKPVSVAGSSFTSAIELMGSDIMPLGEIDPDLAMSLSKPDRERIEQDWQKSRERVFYDSEGAITSAKTMLESLLKYIADKCRISYNNDIDLPKLYGIVSNQLGISAKSQVNDINRKFFGATHSIIQSVGELRNKVGDAHGKGFNDTGTSTTQAEYAVNLAGVVANYLIRMYDSYIAAVHYLTPEGEAVLVFDKGTVWRLVDHSRNAPKHLKSYGERAKAGLWLVGDSGIYLGRRLINAEPQPY